MSKSESRQIQLLKDSQIHFQQMYQESRSEYLELQEQYQTREHLLESLFLEVKKGKLTFPQKEELAQFESQKIQLVTRDLGVQKSESLTYPVPPAVFESHQWKSPYPESGQHPDSTEEIGR